MKLIKRVKVVPIDEGVYFVINGLTGVIDLIDESVYKIYKEWSQIDEIYPKPSEQGVYNNFLKRGYLIEPDKEKEKINDLYDKLENSLNKLKPKINPTFLVTYDCNFRCPYCYEKNVQKQDENKVEQHMTPEAVKKLFELWENDKINIGDITIYGGEPLMPKNKDTIEEILNQARKRQLKVSITTNGYNLDEFIPLLATGNIKKIQVTLDGNEKRHNITRFLSNHQGTFNKIIQNLIKAKKFNLPILVRCNANINENDQIEDLLKVLKANGLYDYEKFEFFIAPLYNPNNSNTCERTFLKKYLNKIDDYVNTPILMKEVLTQINDIATNFLDNGSWTPKYIYCSAHFNQQVFDPLGHIYPCQLIVGEEGNMIGTYDENGIYYNKNYDNWQNRTIRNIPTCKDCSMALICGGGCAVDSLRNHGDMFKVNCQELDMIWEVFLPYLYNKFLKDKISN